MHEDSLETQSVGTALAVKREECSALNASNRTFYGVGVTLAWRVSNTALMLTLRAK